MKRSTDRAPAPASIAARSRPGIAIQVPVASRALAMASASPSALPVRAGRGRGPEPRSNPKPVPLAGRQRRSDRYLRGLTLIELLVAVSIATLVLTLGVTGMTQLVAQNRRVAGVNTLMGNLNFARAEAVYRMANVTVCPIDPANLPAAPADPCAKIAEGDGDLQWQQGYIVFVDNAIRERLRVQDRSGSVRIETSSGRPKVTFRPDGAGTPVTFQICDQRDQSSTDAGRGPGIVPPRAVVVSRVGRVRVSDQHGAQAIDCSTTLAADDDDTDD